MPWTVADVDSKKKGLSPEQKKKWVKIANATYKDCMSKGGSDKTCAPKAIRIANSKFSEGDMKTEIVKLKKKALCFTDHDAVIKLSDKKEGSIRSLMMVAYSGKVIKDHWYWGDLAIDTSGMKMSKPEIPILEDHRTDRKIGFGTFVVDENFQIISKKTSFVETPYAEEFIKLSDQGFPYEASIYARPTKIQRLSENEEVEVNGYKMKGPGTVWRKSVLRECSIVTFGADANTKSAAMAEDEDVELEVESQKFKEQEEDSMDVEKLKAEHPEVYAQVIALGKAEAEASFAEEKKSMTAKITELTAEKTQLTADNKTVSERVTALEKEATIRKEQGIKASAEAVFSEAMQKANIPERLRPKIRKQLDHEAFIKDDQLDVSAFSAAIETELKDWVIEGEGTQSILGMSSTKKEEEEVDSDKLVDRMLNYVGQTVEK